MFPQTNVYGRKQTEKSFISGLVFNFALARLEDSLIGGRARADDRREECAQPSSSLMSMTGAVRASDFRVIGKRIRHGYSARV